MTTNTTLTFSAIAKEALDILTNNLVFVNKVNRSWEGEFSKEYNGYKPGAAVTIRRPARFVTTTGATLQAQNFTELTTSLTVNTQRNVAVSFTSQELTLNMNDFSDRVLKPAMVQMANDVDYDAMSMYSSVYNIVGTPGTTPNSWLSIGNGLRRLQEESAPDSDLTTLFDPAAGVTMADALKGVFVEPTAQEAIQRGFIKKLANTTCFMTQNVKQHTVGALGGTPTLNGVPTSGATSIATTGWTAAAANRLKKGDIFTIAGVYAVNPLNKQTTGVLRNFVVTSDFASDSSGNGNVSIYPAITYSGPTQTVSAQPASNAPITVLTGSANTSYAQNMMFAKDAFAFASVPLEMPNGVDMKAQYTKDGITLRMIRQYDINNDAFPCRLDVLYGYNTVFPELAVRVTG